MRGRGTDMRLLLVAIAGLLLAACASMGRPEGGPRDVEPPVYVRSNPLPGSVNISGSKITIDFNENVQLDNPGEKIVVSPAQKNNPQISANGHRVTVELRDTLLPNTTYTIDFADAIKDLNEGNVLDGFAVDFSTGPVLDSLRISGMVFEAANLEPAQGILVGAYLDRGDTAIRTIPFDRITKTNQLGQFTLRNLKPGAYRVYALKDNNRDFHWDRSEDVAWLDSLVTPWCDRAEVPDTIYNVATGEIDTITTREITRYFPNDIILTWFNENYLAQYLKEYNRPDNKRLQFVLGAPADTLPQFRMLNGPLAGENIDSWAMLTVNQRRDSIEYWVRDERVLLQDSILLEARYQKPDSAERLYWHVDTLKLNLRKAKESKKEKKKKEEEENDSVPKIDFMGLKVSSPQSQDLNKPLYVEVETPIERWDTTGLHLEMMVDTLWTSVAPPRFAPVDSMRPLLLRAEYEWTPGGKYRLTVDSASVADIYGLHNKPLVHEFQAKQESDYSALFFTVTGASGPAFVELLDTKDEPVASSALVDGEAELTFITPGTYYARIVLDANGNGKWDTGLLDSIQPEEVYYYPRAISLKKNWDVEQSWDIYSTPLDLQKPIAIKKNKPARRAGETEPEVLEDELDDTTDEWGNYRNPFDPSERNRPSRNDPYNRNNQYYR